jgi:hypothetical protein
VPLEAPSEPQDGPTAATSPPVWACTAPDPPAALLGDLEACRARIARRVDRSTAASAAGPRVLDLMDAAIRRVRLDLG